MNTLESKLKAFERLLSIMDELREKCPWDKKQTTESLRYLTIEEMYELSDAIVKNEAQEIKNELGDLMLHLVFYAKIASETNTFDIADVINAVCEKLIYRHPHIYSDAKVENEEDVKKNWEQLKLAENGGNSNKTILSGVPKSLPALVKAIRIQEKARSAGFDWDNRRDVWKKVEEELNEFKDEEFAIKPNPKNMQAEFGDLLFSLINYARFVGINPEDALEATNKKFINRFTFLETESKKDGKSLAEMSLDEMEVYWNNAKKSE